MEIEANNSDYEVCEGTSESIVKTRTMVRAERRRAIERFRSSLKDKVKDLERQLQAKDEEVRELKKLVESIARERKPPVVGVAAPFRVTVTGEERTVQSAQSVQSRLGPPPEPLVVAATSTVPQPRNQGFGLGPPRQRPAEDMVEEFSLQLRRRLRRAGFVLPKDRHQPHPRDMWEHLLEFLEKTARPRSRPV